MDEEVYNKIIKKKEFSDLPKKDVELAWEKIGKKQLNEVDEIKSTRYLLMKVFSAFTSQKLLSLKNKEPDWILRKHASTRERIDFYEEIYLRILKGKKYSVIDLGCGVNGFSYKFFKNLKSYTGVEAMGQLVNLTNSYFIQNKLNGKCFHMSLFDLENIKKLVKDIKGHHGRIPKGHENLSKAPKNLKKRFLQGAKIIFLFKTLDSLEMLEKNYSKKLLKEIVPLVKKVVVSFATRSLVSKKKFFAKRTWLVNFINENFNVLDDFELGGERYLVFEASQSSATE